MVLIALVFGLAPLITVVSGHLAAFGPGMWCKGGTNPNFYDKNSNAPVMPLFALPYDQWWFQKVTGCEANPPPPGEFLELPAGGVAHLEIATNQAFTSFSDNGQRAGDYLNGNSPPCPLLKGKGCCTDPNIHTYNESTSTGTSLAIAYVDNLNDVNVNNLVVLSTKHHSPWYRKVDYPVPAAMPACPPNGCICSWNWLSSICGEPNMYMQPFRCKVTGATSTVPLAAPKPAVYCAGDPTKCVQGAKEILAWNEQSGNTFNAPKTPYDAYHAPGYNDNCGFPDGAQNDIFQTPSSHGTSPPAPPAPPATSPVVSPPISQPTPPATPKPTAPPTCKREEHHHYAHHKRMHRRGWPN